MSSIEQISMFKATAEILNHNMIKDYIYLFFISTGYPKTFAPTILENAQDLNNEFPTSTTRVIQGEIQFPQSNGHKGQVVTRTQDVQVYGSPKVD